MAGFCVGPAVDINTSLRTTRHQFDNDMIRHLFDEEKLENADLETNEEALASSTNLSPEDKADKVRQILHMYLLKAENLQFYAIRDWENLVENMYEVAGTMCRKYLREFTKDMCAYGEAAMLCCLVELDLEKNEFKNARLEEYNEPLRRALEAQKSARKAADDELEAVALTLAAKIHRKFESAPTSWKSGSGKRTKTLEVLTDAISLWESYGDNIGWAKALLLHGSVQCFRNNMEDGVSYLVDAQEHFRLAGKTNYDALVMLHIAELHISKREARKAIAYAENAVQLLHSITPKSKYLARAVTALIRALYQRGDETKALQKADEFIEYFRDNGEIRQHIITLVALAEVLHFYEGGEAYKVMEEAMEECAVFPDKRLNMDVLLKGCEMLAGRTEKFAQREQWVAEALDVSNEFDDAFRKARVLQKKKRLHLDQYWLTDDQSAAAEFIQLTKELKAQYEEMGELSMAADAVIDHASFVASADDLNEAWDLAQQGLDLFGQAEDKEGEARAFSLMAELTTDIAERDGDPAGKDHAISYVKKMRKCAQDIGSASLEARSMAFKHNIYKMHDDFALAAQAAGEAVICIRRTQDKDSILTYLLLSCNAYVEKANQDPRDAGVARAIQFAARAGKEALNIARVIRRKSMIGMALLQMTNVLTISQQLEEAMDYAKEALALFRQIKQVPGTALSIAQISMIHYASGKHDEALGAAREVIEIASSSRDEDALEEALRMAESVGDLIAEHRKKSSGTPGDSFPGEYIVPHVKPRETDSVSFETAMDTKLIHTTVLELARSTIGLETIYNDSPLSECGMDSLTAVSFRNALQQNLGVRLNANLVYDNPTVRSIATLLKLKLERGLSV